MIDIEALAALPTKSSLIFLANSDRLTIRVIPAFHGRGSYALGSMTFLTVFQYAIDRTANYTIKWTILKTYPGGQR